MKNDMYRLERIIDLGSQLLAIIDKRGLTSEQILADVESQWLVATPLLAIGEQTNHVSDQLVAKHPNIPWVQIAGLRHRLVHDYENTNWSMIATILFDELEPFLGQVAEVLNDLKDAVQADEVANEDE